VTDVQTDYHEVKNGNSSDYPRILEFGADSSIRSAVDKAAILAEYKDRQHEECFYCHRVLIVGLPDDPFFNDRAYENNAINFVTYREDPFAVEINGDFTKNWICQERVWDSVQEI
jgi:hypothetical protein